MLFLVASQPDGYLTSCLPSLLSQKPSLPPHMHTPVEFTEPSAYKDFTSDHTNHQTRNHFCMGKRKTNMVKQPQIEIKQSLLHVKRSHMDIKYQWSGTKKIYILHIFCPAPEQLAHSSLSWTTIWEESRHLELSRVAETHSHPTASPAGIRELLAYFNGTQDIFWTLGKCTIAHMKSPHSLRNWPSERASPECWTASDLLSNALCSADSGGASCSSLLLPAGGA
ncbi:uncharacterized protein LOC103878643 [Papio anubis]|uniref:uncharacterized protein LOC103878643 n=1 Tax=Papio anubis TaxID=9555 RepID=UPI0012ADF72F|nr:uncharacterized protein LOC103878643 [Papio anubis]